MKKKKLLEVLGNLLLSIININKTPGASHCGDRRASRRELCVHTQAAGNKQKACR
jgi:hypothetical protein